MTPLRCQYFMKNLLRKFVFFCVFGAFWAQMYQKMRYIFYFCASYAPRKGRPVVLAKGISDMAGCASYAPRKGRRKKFRTRYVQWVLQRRFACLREKTPQRYAAFTWRGKPTRRLKTSIGMLCFTVRRALLTTTICGQQPRRYAFWAARRGKNAARNATRRKKRNRARLLKTRDSQGCNKKTFRRALSFDLTGEIAYNLCITTCGVRRKNKGVTVC